MDYLISAATSLLTKLISALFSGEKTADESTGKQTGGRITSGVNTGSIQQTTMNVFNSGESAPKTFKDLSNDDIKRVAKILFIDDQDQSKTIKNLKKLGWLNASQLKEENILNTDCPEYREADLIFVDFSNIGPAKRGQGLSILSSLMSNYGRKKYYVLHTAHPQKITLQKLEESGLPIRSERGWAQLTKGSPDYLFETIMFDGLRQIEK